MAPVKKSVTPGQTTIPQVGVKRVPVAVLDKLQAIATLEGVQYNEIYNLAFVKLIEAYEVKNGKVKVRPKGEGLEGI